MPMTTCWSCTRKMAPIAVAGLVLFRDRRPWTGLRDKALASAALVASLVVAAAPLTVDALEVISAGDHVVVGLRGPGFNGVPGDVATVGQIYNMFTFRGGKVIRWRDYRTREQALAAASASSSRLWQTADGSSRRCAMSISTSGCSGTSSTRWAKTTPPCP